MLNNLGTSSFFELDVLSLSDIYPQALHYPTFFYGFLQLIDLPRNSEQVLAIAIKRLLFEHIFLLSYANSHLGRYLPYIFIHSPWNCYPDKAIKCQINYQGTEKKNDIAAVTAVTNLRDHYPRHQN